MDNSNIRFLIASDVHLGHKEKHNVCFNDSFEAFEEVLAHAKSRDVDFVLLGGDLFDEVNPSMECFYRCLNILQSTVFGGIPARIHVTLNGQPFPSNLQNEKCLVSLPIFTIHGNHDYPTNEFGKVSACDLLHISNHLNYFGKHLNLHEIVVRPLVITKPNSKAKIAIYGLGYIKDLLLSNMFDEKKIVFEQPVGNPNDYFKMFVLHQNRYKKNFQPGVPLSKSFDPRNIPEWMDLVIWGHEHEAIYKLEEQYGRKIFQPGSTISTSYIEAESGKKQCVLLQVKQKQHFSLESILLEKSYRPMFCANLQVQLLVKKYGEKFDLFDYLDTAISEILKESKKISSKQPFIRMKIEYTGQEELVRIKQIQVKYHSYVANREKIIAFWKRKEEKSKGFNDDQVVNIIKAKKIMKQHSTVSEDIENLLRSEMGGQMLKYYQDNILINVVSEMARDETTRLNQIVKKRFGGQEKKKIKQNDDKIAKRTNKLETELKRAMKYYKDKNDLIISDKALPQFYNANTLEQLLQHEGTIIDQSRYQAQIKIMEEMGSSRDEGGKTESQPQSLEKSNQIQESIASRPSILKRQHNHSDHSSIDLNRSDSEDCCQKAQKTPYDEKGNILKFNDAQSRLEESEKQKYKKAKDIKKKPDSMKELVGRRHKNQNKQQKKKPVKEEDSRKNSKNVRFSNDFV